MVGLNERGDEIKYSGYYRRGGSVRGGVEFSRGFNLEKSFVSARCLQNGEGMENVRREGEGMDGK